MRQTWRPKFTREVGETFFVLLDRRRPTPLLHWSFAIIRGETSGINQAICLPQTISENCAKRKEKKRTLLHSRCFDIYIYLEKKLL
jgi:hypothetical protein